MISTSDQKVDQKAYGNGYDLAFGTKPETELNDFRLEPDICSICGRTMIDGLCPEQERTQTERT